MSRRSVALSIVVAMVSSLGCWEQMDDGQWFPQMKRQPAIQAYEEVNFFDQREGFSPPAGTVPVGGAATPDVANMPIADQEVLENPVPVSLESLKRGEELFGRFCAACHGAEGAGNGPVAGPPFGTGPFGLVLPIAGQMSVAKNLTDGHVYTTISIGRGRMPAYRRITPEDRWNLVNYLRELNGQNRQGDGS